MRRVLKVVMHVAVLQIAGVIALLAIAWITLNIIGPGVQWKHVATQFRFELTTVRLLMYAVMAVAWLDTYHRSAVPERRRALLKLGISALLCILLIELQRARG